MGKILDKLLGEAAGGLIPGGKIYYKTLSKGINFLNKVVSNKKEKQQRRKLEAETKLKQLNSIQFQGLQNAGVNTADTPAQSAVFGQQETEIKGSKAAVEPVPIELLDKDGKQIERQTKNKMMNTEWLKKNWYYIAGGAAVLYYLMKRKR